jgi:hypothetical protein
LYDKNKNMNAVLYANRAACNHALNKWMALCQVFIFKSYWRVLTSIFK